MDWRGFSPRKLAGLRCEYPRSWTNKNPSFHPLGKWCRARVCVDALGFGQNVCNSYPINRNIYNERLKLPGLVTSLWWKTFVRIVSTKCHLPPSVPLECLHSPAPCCLLTQTEKVWRVSSLDAVSRRKQPADWFRLTRYGGGCWGHLSLCFFYPRSEVIFHIILLKNKPAYLLRHLVKDWRSYLAWNSVLIFSLII